LRTIIQGGTVIDVVAGSTSRSDVVLEDGRIAAVGEVRAGDDDQVVQAQGSYVAPGFIDSHVHIFSHDVFPNTRLPADRIGVQQGVAALVDTGSAGAPTIDAFPSYVHATQHTRSYALINIGSPGLPALGGGHASRPELCSLSATVAAIERHEDWILGVKVLASASHTGAFGLEATKLARKAAELTGRPLMVHIGNAPPVIDDVLALLRSGDIITHTYHGKVGGVLTYGGEILPAFRDAVERGVLVDLGHGRSSFCFRTCEKAREQGMPVHSISSDLHRGSLDFPAVSLARTMTKMRLIGMNLVDAVKAVTINPARALRLDAKGFGTLEVGNPAHVTLFRERDEPLEVEDSEGDRRTAPCWIEPLTVWVGGRRFDVDAPL
jgi:dihydroorotase